MVIRRRVFRTIFRNKMRFILTLTLIILSSCLYIAFNGNAQSIKDSLDEFVYNSNQEDAHFSILDDNLDIEQLEKQFSLIVQKRYYFDYKKHNADIRILSRTDQVNEYQIVQGYDLHNNNEILLDEKFATLNEYNIEDSIEIAGKVFKVTGYMTQPDYLYKVRDLQSPILNHQNFGLAVIKEDVFETLEEGYPFFSIKKKDESIDLLNVREYLAQNYHLSSWLEKDNNPRINKVMENYEVIMMVGKVVPLIILIITSILTTIIILNQIRNEYTQIGTLYALGYRRKEIIAHYLQYPIILSTTGGILGAIIGQLTGPKIVEAIFQAQFNLPLISYDINVLVISLSVMMPIVIILGVTYLSIRKILSSPPLVLMRGNNKYRVGRLESNLQLNNMKFSSKFRIKEILRNKLRMFLLIAAICFTSWLILFGSVMKDSISFVTNENFSEVYQYQYLYKLQGISDDTSIIGDKLMVTSAFVEGENQRTSFVLKGIENDNKSLRLKDKHNNLLSYDQIIISRHLSQKLDIAEGDTIVFKNTINLEEHQIVVDAVAEVYIGSTLYLPKHKLNQMVGINQNSFNQIMADQEIRNLEHINILTADNIDEVKESYYQLMEPINTFIVFLIIMSIGIGVIVIFIITSIIIENNASNISLMKILGYRDKEIYKLIINTNLIFVLIGFVLSLPLIKASLEALFKGITDSISIYLPVNLTVINVGFTLIIVLVSYEVSKLICKRKVLGVDLAYMLKQRNE
ncbi:ABC transporter permease [Halalkalibacter sp. APA_J-10(15)]|uniref:ABC transporter permease n=1 Tax=Halalkalibacter sp. APA_J-10(15) TaxID=2933805 RepID=UPI001FF3EE0A|nr:ABC transporter permease [Halalkalibacter sp. APA_J-10(15)]MCK0471887.1 ABC transporter permease [Halalkalibacter sp. APA_J-10(15)]